MRRELIFLLLFLTSCDQITDRTLGIKSQNIPLHQSVLLDSKGLTLSNPKMLILGKDSTVCARLIDLTPKGPRINDFDRVMKAIKDSTLSGHMQLSDGKIVGFLSVGKEWTKFGTGVEPNDLSICLVPQDNWQFVPGQSIKSVAIRATPSLQVRGIYWSSTNAEELFK